MNSFASGAICESMCASTDSSFWNEQAVNERLQEIMDDSFDAVVEYAQAHHVNNRIAAYMLALDRVALAIKLRGIYA